MVESFKEITINCLLPPTQRIEDDAEEIKQDDKSVIQNFPTEFGNNIEDSMDATFTFEQVNNTFNRYNFGSRK